MCPAPRWGHAHALLRADRDEVVPYLDTGAFVIEGAEAEDGYTFSGSNTDVEDFGDGEITTVVQVDVALLIDGDVVSGTTNITTTTSCSGECGGFDEESCVSNASFSGVEIEESVEFTQDPP